ncbi:MAG: C-GCAxxG-C-C family protein [Actinobacteria bacterium]|nr:C-GCAxxG-C-C family protein [Actinomycetota bacterium]
MTDRWTEAKEVAMAGFRDSAATHLNCAQAVVLFAAHGFDLDPATVTLARYMGGGSVGMGEICGAVEGVVLSLGIRDYFAPSEHPSVDAGEKALLQTLIRDFGDQFGSATCRGLTGHDISTKEGYDQFKADPISQRCDDYVAWACDRLRSMLGQ